MKHLHIALWGVLPYVVIVSFVMGTVWRFRHDRFGLTTGSSQLHESRLLAIGGPLFHYGLLFVGAGHIIGLLVPERLTLDLDVTESLYRDNALLVGGTAGLAATAGLAVLLWRRLRVRAVRLGTRRTDRVLYPVLAVVLLAGLTATLGGRYDYRLGVSVWFRSLFALDPDVSAMTNAPLAFQAHTVFGMALFALWPFSRLIHAFAAPIGYLIRPYVVYRSRGSEASRGSSRSSSGLWKPARR